MANLILNTELFGSVGIIPYPVSPGASEILEYSTDVLASYTAKSEERNCMRALPRHNYQYVYKAGSNYMQAIFNALSSNIRGKWLIPLWFEVQEATATVGQTVFPVDTTIHDIRANSYVLIFSDVESWQVAKVSAVTNSSITCEASTLQGLIYIVPLRYGFISGQSNLAPNGYQNEIKARFEIEDVLSGIAAVPAQLNGKDFYTTPYLIADAGDSQIYMEEDQTQFEVGGINSSTPWLASRYGKTYLWDDNGQQALRALKAYFYRRQGRFRSFLSPSFEPNLRSASAGIVGTIFKFYDEGYTDNLFATKKLLGFKLNDGTWLTRTASNAIHLGNGLDQLTLSSALNVDANKISYVSFISENRLDTDRLEINLDIFDRFKANASVMEIG